jgi:hypothetical protein
LPLVSIPVSLEDLRAAIAEIDRAPYLLTVSDDGRPGLTDSACGADCAPITLS